MRYVLDLQQLMSQQAISRHEWEKLRWSAPHTPGQPRPDSHWRDWLTDSGSLTQRLRQASNQRFSVQLLQQCLRRPALNESRLLGLGSQEYALIRQVILHGAGQPWVFARTVIPLPTLQQNRHLMQLGNRSLGSVLFRHAGTARTSMEVTRRHPAFCAPFIWGRRSTFRIHSAPLLVTELFLEPFRQSLQLQP